MKRILQPVFLVLMISLNGCVFFGWNENGGYSTTPLPPEIEDWTKSNTDQAQRMKDWISCGGNNLGYVKLSPLKPGQSPYDYTNQTDKQSDAAQACMMKKGYHYIGSCRGEPSRRLGKL